MPALVGEGLVLGFSACREAGRSAAVCSDTKVMEMSPELHEAEQESLRPGE